MAPATDPGQPTTDAFSLDNFLTDSDASRTEAFWLIPYQARVDPVADASSVSVQNTPSTSGSEVGETVVWAAAATDSVAANATFTYQFSVGSAANSLQVVRDFSTNPSFSWTPSDHEGTFYVQATARSSSGAFGTALVPYTVTSRVNASEAVVSPTLHPLVALYSIPPCPAGNQARVRFQGAGDAFWQATPLKTCDGATSVNFYVAGMRASTIYTLQHDIYDGTSDAVGPALTFTTGAIPASVVLPVLSNLTAATVPTVSAYPDILYALSPVPAADSDVAFDPFATDTQSRVIWYLPGYTGNGGYLTRPVKGGTFLGIFDDSTGIFGNHRLLREWDLAGNVVRETSVDAVNAQLQAKGTDSINGFSHEVYRLANGDTAVIGVVERLADQGAGIVDVLGDMAIVLDSNLQLKWYWNAFNHLDVKQGAVLGETCAQGNPGCGPFYMPGYTVANDWMHSNSLTPTPDGNLVLSVRHLDWVLKLNYNTGQSDGPVLWALGNGGNFQPVSSSPYPFFTHQHDVEFDARGNLLLFDNGNTRVAEYGGVSRGQAWSLDETRLVATSVFDQDLPAYSLATGSAQLLTNGNYEFYSGALNNNTASTVIEYTPLGEIQFEESLPSRAGYRAFRMNSLYTEYAAGELLPIRVNYPESGRR